MIYFSKNIPVKNIPVKNIHRISLAACLAFALCIPIGRALGADEDYAIKLHRSANVGDGCTLKAIKSQRQKTDAPGMPMLSQSNEARYELHGSEVVTSSSNGNATKVRLTVDSLTLASSGNSQDLVPKGTILSLTYKDGKLTVMQENTELGPEVAAALEGIVDIDDPAKTVNDDDQFGTPDRKKIGAKWDINKAKVAQFAKESGVDVAPADVSGSVQLLGTKDVDAKKCLDLEMDLTFKNMKIPVPPGMTVDKGEGTVKVSVLLPIDVKLPAGSDHIENNISIAMSGPGPDGKPMQIQSTTTETTDVTRTDFHAGPGAN
jgi:hypothetical protein